MITRLKQRLQDVGALSQYGERSIDRLRIALLVLTMPLFRRVGRSRPARLRIRIEGQSLQWYVDNDADVAVLREVFTQNSYDTTCVDPKIVVDLGSHVGSSVLFFTRRFPAARVLAVEADPRNYRKLVRNVGHLPQVTALNLAVSDKTGDTEMFSAGGLDSWKSSTVGEATPFSTVVRVQADTLDSILKRSNITEVDLLKIDVEGAEMQVLRAFDGLSRVRRIVGEAHPDLMGGTMDDLRRVLDGFDVEIAEGGGNRLFHAVRVS
jgi:FkbM family methyltransferase